MLTAQCYRPPNNFTPQVTISQHYFAPGTSSNVTLIDPQGYFVSDSTAKAYFVPQSSGSQGIFYQEDANATVSNLTYVSPNTVTFTITIAPGSSNESNDYWSVVCLGNTLEGGGMGITPCATASQPTISTIHPGALFAGAATNLTITGSNFVVPSNPNSCPNTTVNFNDPNGNVSIGAYSVVNSTTITATITPTASSSGDVMSISAFNGQDNGPPYGVSSAAYNEQVLPAPSIQWNGSTISGSSAAQAVVAGQPVNLTTTANNVTISSSAWTVGGTNINGYTPTAGSHQSAAKIDTVLTTTSLATYWVFGGTKLPVTYSYCTQVSGTTVCSPAATAYFTVTGAGTGKLSITDYGSATIENLYTTPNCNSSSTAPYMGYGSLTGPGPECGGAQSGTPGIIFTASNASSKGAYRFVQNVDTDTRVYTNTSGGTSTCPTLPGLDLNYYYSGVIGTTQSEDGPESPLPAIYTKASRTFAATMYSMWLANSIGNAIPVPLGFQKWQFQASTTNSKAPSQASWAKPTTQAHGAVGSFTVASATQANDGYPVWSNLASSQDCH